MKLPWVFHLRGSLKKEPWGISFWNGFMNTWGEVWTYLGSVSGDRNILLLSYVVLRSLAALKNICLQKLEMVRKSISLLFSSFWLF